MYRLVIFIVNMYLSQLSVFLKKSGLLSDLIKFFFLICIFRFGGLIVLPGIDVNSVTKSENGLLKMLDLFLGGAFGNISIFGLGIMPYINASIIVHLLSLIYPSFQRISMDGQYGRSKMSRITKGLTLLISVFQSIVFLNYLVQDTWLIVDRKIFLFIAVFVLSAGSMVCVWIGEKITDCGFGQGISTLILIGILSTLPSSIYEEFVIKGDNVFVFVGEIFFFISAIFFAITINLAVRKIKLLRVKETMSFEDLGRKIQYLPQKFIGAGIMPVIFAQVFMFMVSFVFKILSDKNGFCLYVYESLANVTSLFYCAVYALVIVLFSYMYLAININPMKIADDLKRGGEFIPGVTPGKPTADYIDRIMNLIAFPGSISLIIVAILPTIATSLGVGQSFSHFFGGTSLLILVSSGVENVKYIESFLLLYRYERIDEFSVGNDYSN